MFFVFVKINARVGDLDAAPDCAGAEETLTVRIGHGYAVDRDRVVVKTRIERLRCPGPIAIIAFFEIRVEHASRLGVGCVNAECRTALRLYFRILNQATFVEADFASLGKGDTTLF